MWSVKYFTSENDLRILTSANNSLLRPLWVAARNRKSDIARHYGKTRILLEKLSWIRDFGTINRSLTIPPAILKKINYLDSQRQGWANLFIRKGRSLLSPWHWLNQFSTISKKMELQENSQTKILLQFLVKGKRKNVPVLQVLGSTPAPPTQPVLWVDLLDTEAGGERVFGGSVYHWQKMI